MDPNFTCTVENDAISEDLEDFRCALATLSLILYNINFGYICIGLLILIGFISIFGGIEKDYRWFILNQVIWDFLLCYDFICNNIIGEFFYDLKICYRNEILDVLEEQIQVAAYSSLFLLSFTRFLCLYFKNFYEKLTKNFRIFLTIFIFNFFIVFINLSGLIHYFALKRLKDIYCNKYIRDEQILLCYFKHTSDSIFQKLVTAANILQYIGYTIPSMCLFFSIISTIMIIIKISKQFKFQLKNNEKAFYISLRFSIVIAFQTILYFFIFCFEFIRDIFLLLFGGYDILPIWISGGYGLSWPSNIQSFIQIRIFLDSLIILFIMSGYREAIIKFAKVIFANPIKKFARKRNTILFNTRITPILTTANSEISTLNLTEK